MATTGIGETVETDVLIVGAGPVGMTLALTLRKFGARVTVADADVQTARYPRAAVVWPRTLEMLDLLGIEAGWSDEGVPIHLLTLTIDGTAGTLETEGVASPYPYPLGIGQDFTERLLDTALKSSGADYRRGVEVRDLQITESGVTATLHDEMKDDTTVRASWVVGCEGAHSLVREQAKIGFTGEHNSGVMLVQGDVCLRGSLPQEPHHGYVWSTREQAIMLVMPIRQDGHYRVLVALPDDGQKDAPTLDQLQEHARRIIPDVQLYDPIWLNRFRTQHRIANAYRAGRAFVAGDAAHVWVPIGGQGMNIGMQDAFNLGWKLARVVTGTLPEAVLDTYEAERRPIGVQNIEDTEHLYGAIMRPHTFGDSSLRLLLPHLLGIGPVSHRVAERFAQLDFHYAPNALVAGDQGGSGIPAGKRAPDAYISRVATGETVRLFDLYRSGRWQAFAWAFQPEDLPVLEQTMKDIPPFVDAYVVDATHTGLTVRTQVPLLRDMLGRAADAFEVNKATIHIVRPDGVVAYRGAPRHGLPESITKLLTP